jgi:hypothetical protein
LATIRHPWQRRPRPRRPQWPLRLWMTYSRLRQCLRLHRWQKQPPAPPTAKSLRRRRRQQLQLQRLTFLPTEGGRRGRASGLRGRCGEWRGPMLVCLHVCMRNKDRHSLLHTTTESDPTRPDPTRAETRPLADLPHCRFRTMSKCSSTCTRARAHKGTHGRGSREACCSLLTHCLCAHTYACTYTWRRRGAHRPRLWLRRRLQLSRVRVRPHAKRRRASLAQVCPCPCRACCCRRRRCWRLLQPTCGHAAL